MSRDFLSTDDNELTQSELTSTLFDAEQLDGQRSEGDSLDAWLADDAAASQWHRYSIISSSLKGDLSDAPTLDISAQVSAAIADEKLDNVVSMSLNSKNKAARKASLRWLQPAGKIAVAASVAVVAVLSVQSLQQPTAVPNAEQPALMTNPLGGREPVSYSPAVAAPSEAQQQAYELQMRRQAQSYLIDHQQQTLIVQPSPQANAEEVPEENNTTDKPSH